MLNVREVQKPAPQRGSNPLNEKSPARGQAFQDLCTVKARWRRWVWPSGYFLMMVTSLPTSGNTKRPLTAFTPFTRHSQV